MKRVLYKKIIILIREKYLTYLKYPPSKLKIDLIDIFLKNNKESETVSWILARPK